MNTKTNNNTDTYSHMNQIDKCVTEKRESPKEAQPEWGKQQLGFIEAVNQWS